MITFQEFMLTSKHFCLIRSDIPFRLICNPNGSDWLSGTDVCNLPAGSFTFDFWKLLPEKYFKNNPAFKLGLAYDADLLTDGRKIDVSYSDLDYGTGVSGLAGSAESSLAEIILIDTLISDNVAEILSHLRGFRKHAMYKQGYGFPDTINEVFNGLYPGRPMVFECSGFYVPTNYTAIVNKGRCYSYNGEIFWEFLYHYSDRENTKLCIHGTDNNWIIEAFELPLPLAIGESIVVTDIDLVF